jgi:hypothetical protein
VQVASCDGFQVNVTGVPEGAAGALDVTSRVNGVAPEIGTLMGTPLTTSVSGRVGAPETVGLKLTPTVHAAPGASDTPQVLDTIGNCSDELGAPSASDVVPSLLNVTDCGVLVVPTCWTVAKVKGPGATLIRGTCNR